MPQNSARLAKSMSLRLLSRFLSSQNQARFFATSSPSEEFHSHLRRCDGDLEKILSTVNVNLDVKCVIDVIDRCDLSQAQMGLRFFVWAGLQRGYRHSPFAYEKACKIFKLNQNPNVIYDVLEAYRLEKCVVSVKTIKIVLNLCKEAKLASEALWVLRKMYECGLRADSTIYSGVIRLFCWKGDMDTAESLMREMIEMCDLYPDMVTFVEMVQGFCKAARFDEAFRLFKLAKEHGCLLNTVLYTSLVDGLCKSGDMDRAFELLEEMERGGEEIRPNVVTYTCVIQRFCEEGWTSEAIKVLCRMEARGCFPNQVTASCLIEQFCKEGRVEEVYGLIDRVVGRGGVSEEKCYSSLVVALNKNGQFEEAEKVFRNMLGSGMRPDSLASCVVVKESCLSGRVLNGYQLVIEIKRMGCLVTIDSSLFSALLAGLCQQEHLVEATEIARLMLKRGIRLRAPYVDTILLNLKKCGDEELVRNLTGI